MAKTQYSFSDDATLLGAPEGFEITIRELEAKTGAGFIVALTGAIMTMPGLPKQPAALKWMLQMMDMQLVYSKYLFKKFRKGLTISDFKIGVNL